MSARTRIVALALCVVGARPTVAQSLAERVERAGDGVVQFQYAARPGVCGDGESYLRLGDSYVGSFSTSRARSTCEAGPVQVALTLRGGTVEQVRSWVGRPRSRDGRDLGTVPAPEAARYLLTLAQGDQSSVGVKAILPAVLADSATVWPALLSLARDTRGRSSRVRSEAGLWLSRYAAAAVMGRENSPFDVDDDARTEGDELKSHAVFVLSQLPRHEGVPELLQVARTNRDPRVRSRALFWLGQSGDERALELFEELLARR